MGFAFRIFVIRRSQGLCRTIKKEPSRAGKAFFFPFLQQFLWEKYFPTVLYPVPVWNYSAVTVIKTPLFNISKHTSENITTVSAAVYWLYSSAAPSLFITQELWRDRFWDKVLCTHCGCQPITLYIAAIIHCEHYLSDCSSVRVLKQNSALPSPSA